MSWSERDIPDQSGRLAVVTGANSGIGFETARALAEHGARVVLACRNETRGKDAEARLRSAVPEAECRFRPLDLGSLESVESFARNLAEEESRLDLLCNNAGVMMPPYGLTADGFETQFGTNHLGHFALTGRLLGLLLESEAPRVVSVSSLAHLWGRIDFEDLDSKRRYNATMAYGQSKLANLLFIRELDRRFRKSGGSALAAAAHPGSTRTNLQQHSKLMAGVVAVLYQEAPAGALPSLYAATAPGVQGGAYYGPSGPFGVTGPPGPARSTPAARNMAVAEKLWEVSERLTGVHWTL